MRQEGACSSFGRVTWAAACSKTRAGARLRPVLEDELEGGRSEETAPADIGAGPIQHLCHARQESAAAENATVSLDQEESWTQTESLCRNGQGLQKATLHAHTQTATAAGMRQEGASDWGEAMEGFVGERRPGAVGARPWGGGKELIREVMQELWSEEKGRESEKEVKRDQEIQELKAREQAMARGVSLCVAIGVARCGHRAVGEKRV